MVKTDFDKKTIFLFDEINMDEILEAIKFIVDINDKMKEINSYDLPEKPTERESVKDFLSDEKWRLLPTRFYLNSRGGFITPLWGLIDMLYSNAMEVQTTCVGTAYSSAAMILLCGSQRAMTKDSTILLHGAYTSSDLYGNRAYIDSSLKCLEEDDRKIMELILKRTNITKDLYMSKTNGGSTDWLITAKEALKYGIVNIIL